MADLALWGYNLLRGGAPEQVAVAISLSRTSPPAA